MSPSLIVYNALLNAASTAAAFLLGSKSLGFKSYTAISALYPGVSAPLSVNPWILAGAALDIVAISYKSSHDS